MDTAYQVRKPKGQCMLVQLHTCTAAYMHSCMHTGACKDVSCLTVSALVHRLERPATWCIICML